MPDPVTTSPSGSFAGWSFRAWLAKNKGAVKIVAAGLAAYLVSLPGLIHDPQTNALVSGVVGLACKFGLDVLDYYVSDVTNA